MNRRSWIALPLLLVAACSGSSTTASKTTPTPTPTESTPIGPASPAPPTVFPYPSKASEIPALQDPPPYDHELARVSNNANPSQTTATLTVVVKKGQVIETDLICQGRGSVIVTTVPDSQAEQTISCDGNALPSTLGVFSSIPEKADRTYVIHLRTTGPSRWILAVADPDPS